MHVSWAIRRPLLQAILLLEPGGCIKELGGWCFLKIPSETLQMVALQLQKKSLPYSLPLVGNLLCSLPGHNQVMKCLVTRNPHTESKSAKSVWQRILCVTCSGPLLQYASWAVSM